MTVYEWEQFSKKNINKPVYIYGAGQIGCTWAYDIIASAGYNVCGYIDSNKKDGDIVNQPDNIYKICRIDRISKDSLIFICVNGYHNDIVKVLSDNNLTNYLFVDDEFYQEFMRSLDNEDFSDDLRLKYDKVYDDEKYLGRIWSYIMGGGEVGF